MLLRFSQERKLSKLDNVFFQKLMSKGLTRRETILHVQPVSKFQGHQNSTHSKNKNKRLVMGIEVGYHLKPTRPWGKPALSSSQIEIEPESPRQKEKGNAPTMKRQVELEAMYWLRKYDRFKREMEAMSNLVSREKRDKPSTQKFKRKKDTTISEANPDEPTRDLESVYTFLENEDRYQSPFKPHRARTETTQQEKHYIPTVSSVGPKQNPGLILRESNAHPLLKPVDEASTPTPSKVEHKISISESAPKLNLIQRVQQELQKRIERYLLK
jgi:hypothetical protein